MTGIRRRLATAIFTLSAAFALDQPSHYVLNSEASGLSMVYTTLNFVRLKQFFFISKRIGITFNASIQPGPPSMPTFNK